MRGERIFDRLDTETETRSNPYTWFSADLASTATPVQFRDVGFVTRRRIRQILLASLLALYGALTVGGSALHSLPGAGHAKAGTAARGDDSDRPTSPHDDCPVCHFLAQGQITGSSAHVPCLDVVGI